MIDNLVPDKSGACLCALGVFAQMWIGKRLRIASSVSYVLGGLVALAFLTARENFIPPVRLFFERQDAGEWFEAAFLLWLISLLVTCLFLFLTRKVPAVQTRRREFLKRSTAVACAAPIALLGIGFITRKNVRVEEVDIRFSNLPEDLRGLKLLLLSDIHMGAFFSARDLARVVDTSNTLQADMVFVAGDLITTEWDPLDRCLIELKRLRSGSGIWGCMGNHELYAKVQSYTKAKGRMLGIDFLRQENQIIPIGKSRINLVGVDYQRPRIPYLDDVERLIVPGAFNLLLSHNPDVFPTAAEKGLNLTLSGHTHGGQINLDILGTNLNPADFVTPYTKGLYRRQTSSVYVTAGLGTITLPVRLGAPPEITLLRLNS